MNGNDFSTKYFEWQDKQGCMWKVRREESQTMVHWRAWCVNARPIREGGKADVKVLEIGSLIPMRMARLMDVVVDKNVENRGIGSMLITAAMGDCQRRGSRGMDGEISSIDKDHFPKLKHFYEKTRVLLCFVWLG